MKPSLEIADVIVFLKPHNMPQSYYVIYLIALPHPVAEPVAIWRCKRPMSSPVETMGKDCERRSEKRLGGVGTRRAALPQAGLIQSRRHALTPQAWIPSRPGTWASTPRPSQRRQYSTGADEVRVRGRPPKPPFRLRAPRPASVPGPAARGAWGSSASVLSPLLTLPGRRAPVRSDTSSGRARPPGGA